MKNCRKYFTLIELLVVIAILGVLISLLQSSLRSMIARGHQISCASNLKQIGAAILSYADDYGGMLFPKYVIVNGSSVDSKVRAWWGPNGYLDGYLPPRSYKHGGFIGYRENNAVFDCPSNSLPCTPTGWAQTPGEGGYGAVTGGGVFYETTSRKLSSLKRTHYAMVGDINISPLNVTKSNFFSRMPYVHHMFYADLWFKNGPNSLNEVNWVAYRHSGDVNFADGGGNYLLVDGSVKYFSFISLLDRTKTGEFYYYFMAP